MNRNAYFASILAVLWASGAAIAQVPATTTFNVQITIEAECLINSASDLNFGSPGLLDSNVDATSEITVRCTPGTPYQVGLNQGQGDGATVATRLMTGPDAETIEYSVYQDSGRSILWGNTEDSDTAPGTGTGSPFTHTVYGRVPSQTTPPAGTYSDIITVTVTY